MRPTHPPFPCTSPGRAVCAAAVLCTSLALPSAADTIHVPGDAATIAAALELAADGDVIELASGTFEGPGNRDLMTFIPTVTIRGSQDGSTIIECGGTPDDPHWWIDAYSSDVTLENLTVRGGWTADGGGIISALPECEGCGGGSFVMHRCAVVANQTSGGAGAVWIQARWWIEITDCRFEENTSDSYPALDAAECGSFTMDRCVVAHNSGAWAGGLFIGASICNVSNLLVHHNTSPGYAAGYVGAQYGGSISYSTFADNIPGNPEEPTPSLFLSRLYLRGSIVWDWPGSLYLGQSTPLASCIKGWHEDVYQNTAADPRFVDAASGDYRLRMDSPLLDFGLHDPQFGGTVDLQGLPRDVDLASVPNGPYSSKDLGCYERQSEAGPADLDANGVVDGADLGALLSAWGEACVGCPADLNGDGLVNGTDLGILLGCWG